MIYFECFGYVPMQSGPRVCLGVQKSLSIVQCVKNIQIKHGTQRTKYIKCSLKIKMAI